MKQNFCIRIRAKLNTLGLQLKTQLPIIIYLAVKYDGISTIRRMHRLMAGCA